MTKITLKPVTETFPGLSLCGLVTAAAFSLEALEQHFLGRAWLESLVLAILLGSGVRTFSRLDERFEAGIRFGANPACTFFCQFSDHYVDGSTRTRC